MRLSDAAGIESETNTMSSLESFAAFEAASFIVWYFAASAAGSKPSPDSDEGPVPSPGNNFGIPRCPATAGGNAPLPVFPSSSMTVAARR